MKRQDMRWFYSEDGNFLGKFWRWLAGFVKKNPPSMNEMKRQDMQWFYFEDGNFLKKFWWWLVGVVNKNPPSLAGILSIIGALASSFMLFIGSVFAIMVSAKNGYLPDVNLVDVTTTLFAIALVGLAAIVLIGISFVSSVALVVFIKPNLNTPLNSFTFVLPPLLTAIYLFNIMFSLFYQLSPGWFLVVLIAITLICSLVNWRKNYSSCTLKENADNLGRLFISGFVLLLGLCSVFPVMLEVLSKQQDDEMNAFFLLELFIFFWGVINFALIKAFLDRKINKLRVVLCIILSIFFIPPLLSFGVGNFTMVPTMTFRLLGLGEIPVTLALKEDACSALAQQTDSDSIRCQQGMVKHVMLKSRIGGWFMIEPILEEKKNSDDLGNVQKFLIRKEDVKFWIIERKKNKDEAVADAAAGDQ
jgi:hypothetical protein